MKYTKVHMSSVENAVSSSSNREARFLSKPLSMEQAGMSLQSYKPGYRSAFGHKHSVQEEVIVILSGAGSMKLDDEIISVTAGDAVRVTPGVMQALEAGPDGLKFLIFGAPKTAKRDFEIVQDWWTD